MRTPRKQAGMTLISTLVGVTLSLVTLGAMMMLHRTLAVSSTETNQELQRDGQVWSATQNALVEIQQAGYGITPGEAGQNLWASSDGKRVSWRYRQSLTDAGYRCGGLWVVPEETAGLAPGLYLFRDVACASAGQDAVWQAQYPQRQTLASGRAFYEAEGGEVLGMKLSQAVFVKENASQCLPYAASEQAQTSHPMISLLIDGQPIFRSCLVNLSL